MSTKTLSVSDVLINIILSLAFTAAPYYINDGKLEINLGYVLTALTTFAVFLLITYMLRKFLKEYDWNTDHPESKHLRLIEKLLLSKKSIWIIAAIIFAAWIIPLCFLYPGTIINDTWNELQQFICLSFSDHHPIFDTLVMGIIIVPLSRLTGKWHLIIFLYVLLQAALTSFAFAATISYTYRKLNLGLKAAIVLLLIYCIIPIFPAAVQTISKDALHSWGFVLFTVLYIELIRTNGTAIKEKNFLLKFILVILYCCLTKKVGVYVIVLSLSVAIIFLKYSRKYLVIPIAAAILLMGVLMPAARTFLNIAPGGKQEIFSLPFQMTARYVKEHGDDITEDEYEILDKVLTMDTLADRYNPTNADPVKDYYQKADGRYYIKYITVWFKQGVRHPDSYVSAFNAMLSGWFSWHEYAPLMNSDWRTQHNTELIPESVAVRGMTDSTANAYEEMFHNLYNIPIIQFFLSYGLYASLLPAFALSTVMRKWKNKDIKYWMALFPLLSALFFGCWLAPVSYQIEGMRYLYPIVYTIPIIIMWCIYIYKNNNIDLINAKEM